MKRVALALAFFVVAGTASAAIFSPPSPALSPRSTSTPEIVPRQAASLSPAVKSSAPLILETGRAPVPFTPLPKPPAPQIASLSESPPPAVVQTPPAPPAPAKSAIERVTVKEVRNLSEGRCGGRTMKSITVLPDGSVHVQC
jgi:hypothetical protein